MLNKLKILYEDNHIIVVIKPVNIPVQADKSGDIDMLSMIKDYIKEKYNKPGNVYVGIVHRLDRMVGGVMVFAKTSKAASRLSEYIRQKNVKKRYLAILNGKLEISNEVKKLEDYLVKNQEKNMSSVVKSSTNNSKLAVLEYNVLENFIYKNKEYSLVDVDLQTGRHHQIRVQFQNLGNPLYGDIKYGQKINKVGQSLGLWSYYLSFFHPTKDEYLEFSFKPSQIEEIDDLKIDKIWESV